MTAQLYLCFSNSAGPSQGQSYCGLSSPVDDSTTLSMFSNSAGPSQGQSHCGLSSPGHDTTTLSMSSLLLVLAKYNHPVVQTLRLTARVLSLLVCALHYLPLQLFQLFWLLCKHHPFGVAVYLERSSSKWILSYSSSKQSKSKFARLAERTMMV